MRIAVCDSDQQELAGLSGMIMEYQIRGGGKADCQSFQNGLDFLCDVKGGEYDLVFLGARMSGISGLGVARELRERDKNVKIIFVSDSPKFASESYDVGAYYCLLKPVNDNSLFSLLGKVEEELARQEKQGFVLKNRKGVIRVLFTWLEYVEVINKTVFFHLTDGVIHEVTAALSDFEEKLLARPEFIKIHRSYLVNLNYVQAIDSYCVVTKNGHSIPVSRQRRNQVQDAYISFQQQTETVCSRADTQEGTSLKMQRRSPGPWRILLADDDEGERKFWADILRSHGCVVRQAKNGEEAVGLATEESYDCVLLDVMIPGEDGFSICKKLRGLGMDMPVIFLSCLTESDQQLEGFAAGGIDYITKDTPPELFWAKVETRIKLASSIRTQLEFGPLLLDLGQGRAQMNGEDLSLNSKEFDILWKLSEHPEHVFTPEEIFGMFWGDRPWDGGSKVQIYMTRLRRKLGQAWGGHCFIATVWGQGYRFVPVSDQ